MGAERPTLLLENRRAPVPSGGRADAQKAAKDTKTDQELGSCHDPALPEEWGPRNTQKDAKGDERCGLGGHVTSRDPTLDAVGTRSCAIRRGMSKKRATAIFDRSLRVGPPSLCVLRGLLCKFSLLPSISPGPLIRCTSIAAPMTSWLQALAFHPRDCLSDLCTADMEHRAIWRGFSGRDLG